MMKDNSTRMEHLLDSMARWGEALNRMSPM